MSRCKGMHHRSHGRGGGLPKSLCRQTTPWIQTPPSSETIGILRDTVNKRAVHILLEWMLVDGVNIILQDANFQRISELRIATDHQKFQDSTLLQRIQDDVCTLGLYLVIAQKHKFPT